MDYSKENQNWDSLSYEEKNHQLFLKQKALLDYFLEKGAISQAQHDIVSMGSINGSIASIPNILKSGILSNAYGFLLLHNHPSGDVTPSREDIQTTRRCIEAGKIMDTLSLKQVRSRLHLRHLSPKSPCFHIVFLQSYCFYCRSGQLCLKYRTVSF